MGEGLYSGGTYVSWGTENRESAVRLCGDPSSRRFEIRCVDGTSNPYLSLASILAAVNHGLDAKKTLSVAGCEVTAAKIGKEKREELGIGERRLPLKLEEAREYLAQNEVLRKGLGDEFVTKYLAVNEVRSSNSQLDGHMSTQPKQFLDAPKALIGKPRTVRSQQDCKNVLASKCRTIEP